MYVCRYVCMYVCFSYLDVEVILAQVVFQIFNLIVV